MIVWYSGVHVISISKSSNRHKVRTFELRLLTPSRNANEIPLHGAMTTCPVAAHLGRPRSGDHTSERMEQEGACYQKVERVGGGNNNESLLSFVIAR